MRSALSLLFCAGTCDVLTASVIDIHRLTLLSASFTFLCEKTFRFDAMHLLPLIVISYNAHAYARDEKSVGYVTTCTPGQGGCGFGIFNEKTCECNCIPPYCFDELYQSCVSVRVFC